MVSAGREACVLAHIDARSHAKLLRQLAALGAGLEQAFLESLPGAIAGKHPLAVIAAVDDVINRARIFQPYFACHGW